jgi:hypothetical protein
MNTSVDQNTSGNMPDPYDRAIGALHGLPDVVSTKPTTIQTVAPLVGHTQTFIVQTYRQDGQGDTIFLQSVGRDGTTRLVIPAKVADAIARQRESLTTKVRKKVAKRVAQERKDAGIVPFAKKRKG